MLVDRVRRSPRQRLSPTNGYLLDQFLESSTNMRTDLYGGSIENRHTLRLTWQASAKHKVTISDSIQRNCNCHLFVDIGTRAPEAAVDYTYFGINLAQATWSYPATNKLLFQAGATVLRNMTEPRSQPEVSQTDIALFRAVEEFQLQC